MAVRMTGLISNLDTEGIIKEMMKAQNLKKTKVENRITKLEWKQEKWKELNAKIYKLYTDSLADMKTEGIYLTKKASSTNEGKLTAKADSGAAEGTHYVTVTKLASAQYLTGSKINAPIENPDLAINLNTKLEDLGFDASGTSVIRIQMNGNESATQLAIDSDTTIGDFLTTCRDAGLNASFDTSYKRIFLSSRKSGVEGAFRITTGISSAGDEREAIKDIFDYDNLSGTQKSKLNQLIDHYREASLGIDGEKIIDAETELWDYLATTIEGRVKKETETAYREGLASSEDFDQETLNELTEAAVADALTEISDKSSELENALIKFAEATEEEVYSPSEDGGLKNLGLSDVDYSIDANGEISYSELDASTGASLTKAADGAITFNQATFTSSSNNYKINGLTLTANELTSVGETISVTINKDVDAVYDKVKGFIKQYNELLEEMNKLYGAEDASDYDILTDEERDAMTEEQIEKWEEKIKGSLLRRDSTLNSLLSTMKTSLAKSITVDGKDYALSSFGIVTSDYKEKGKLHLQGDSEDAYGKEYEDKLKSALSENPDTVMKVLSGVMGELYSKMTTTMSSSSLSSALTFYNDKQLDKTMKNYKEELSTLEDRLQEIEDRYYKQFTAMEVAMSKLNSQQNSMASLFGSTSK